MVSVLTFNSDNASSNPTEAYSFFRKCVFEKNENKQKEAMVTQIVKNKYLVYFCDKICWLDLSKMTQSGRTECRWKFKQDC